MEPRRYMSLATWAKDRVARLEAVSSDVAEGDESDEPDGSNVLAFGFDAAVSVTPLQEAA